MRGLTEQSEVIVHTLLYILKQTGARTGFHKLFKILYFAEQKHLAKYGSSITGDKFIAMKDGPVPSIAYDIFKAVKEIGFMSDYKETFSQYFKIEDVYCVTALCEPDLDNLAPSEINVLNESIVENKNLSWGRLRFKSHDKAWNKAGLDGEMDPIAIAKAGNASKDLIGYLQENIENETAKFS